MASTRAQINQVVLEQAQPHEPDWLLQFLSDFATMTESEQDAALDGLSATDRGALLALSEQRTATAGADLVEVLDAGQAGIEKLYEVLDPEELHTVIGLAAREHPQLLVEALFAAVVLHRNWQGQEPPAIASLRERWHWHVHERVVAARERAGESSGSA
jgi:hypothetical protein